MVNFSSSAFPIGYAAQKKTLGTAAAIGRRAYEGVFTFAGVGWVGQGKGRLQKSWRGLRAAKR